MKILKNLCGVALLSSLMAVFASSAMAVTPEAHPVSGGFPVAGTGTSGFGEFTTASGLKLSCTSGTGSGQATSSTTGEGSGILHGCIGPFGLPCTSEGQPNGTIKVETSVSHLVYLDEKHTKVGVLTTPPASGVFAKFSCAGVLREVKGNGMLAEVTSPKCGETSTTSTVVAATSAPGTQKYLQVEETGTVYDLTLAGSTAAIASSGTTTSERAGTLTCPDQT